MERAPRWIGQYQVFDELGRGGFGVVYLARHPNLDRPVALKLLLDADHVDDKMVERFHLEAQAAAKIRHPAMVKIHDLGVHNGKPYYVMEYVEGQSLKQRLEREGPFEIEEAVAVLIELCDAVIAAHDEGILHRDLKPENVIDVVEEGRLKLADFGLARELGESREKLTRTGAMLGTPGYMSPEQAAGERDRIDVRTDVYGLGATLFALLAGRPPFRGDSPLATVTALLREEAPPVSRFRSEVPSALDAICARTLAKTPGGRYETVRALRRDLERYRRGEKVEKTSDRLVRQVRTSSPWKKWVALIGGLTLCVGGSTAAALTLGQRDAEASPTPASEWEVALSAGEVHAEQATVRGRVTGPPGARVKVGRKRVELDAEGRFEARVEVPYGAPVEIVVRVRGEAARPVRQTITLEAQRPGWFDALGEGEGPPRPLREDLELLPTPNRYRHRKDGSEFSWIPPGTFEMGAPRDAVNHGLPPQDSNEVPWHRVTLTKGYFFGIHEISRAKFARFCADSGLRKGGGEFKGDAASGVDQLPANVKWGEAKAYCEWLGGRLPTEPEWAYAAKGGDEQRFYPWGNSPLPQQQKRAHGKLGGEALATRVDDLEPGRARWGQLNMAGNAAEWTADAYRPSYPVELNGSRTDPPPVTHEDPEALPERWAARGGDHSHGHPDLAFRCAGRSKRNGLQPPDERPFAIGIRVLLEERAP